MKKATTGKIHGGGSMPFRWVSGLTKKDQELVKAGKKVYLKTGKTHYTQSGYKIIKYSGHGYQFREPTDNELAQIKK